MLRNFTLPMFHKNFRLNPAYSLIAIFKQGESSDDKITQYA